MPQTATKKRTSAKKSSASRSRSNSSAKAKKATPRAKSTAKSSSQSSNGSLAQKAKAPAMAAGAALLGLAGGVAAARNGKRRRPHIPRPKGLHMPKGVSLPQSGGSTAAWVGEKAKGLGDAGHRLADVTEQVAKIEKTLRK
jgi:hypothetical protein